MKIFAFNPADYADRYREQGWVHIRGGMDPEFLAELQSFTARSLETTRLDNFAIKGKKEQSLYEFPKTTDFPNELFDVVATVCGLNRETMTLSERHIQAYEAAAHPEPEAHKDRYPSQVSIGFSISIPTASRLVLYPHDCRQINPFNAAAGLIRSLQPYELPEVVLKDAQEVEIADRAGDVVMFPGSTTWHLRRQSGGAVNLYVKLNDFDCDPLGEDPLTVVRRERTARLLSDSGADDLGRHRVKVSRRLDYVSRQMTRNYWQESLQCALYGEQPFGLTATQLEIIMQADGSTTLDQIADRAVGDGQKREAIVADARILLERGALDLLL